MGEHKNNKTAIAAKNNKISPKKKPMSKRQQESLIKAAIVKLCTTGHLHLGYEEAKQ